MNDDAEYETSGTSSAAGTCLGFAMGRYCSKPG
jgi:hypothetical protein